MKIWIIGANGLLGRSLSALCKTRGIAFSASSKTEADITDFTLLKKQAEAINPTHIINCAAYTDVDKAEKESELAFLINATGPENLAKLALSRGCKLQHVSTDYVFDGTSSTPYCEDDACAPLGVYATSKWEGEQRLLAVDPNACIVRTSWLFGVGGKSFISTFYSLMQQREEIRVVADQKGRPTFCRDLSAALLSLLPYSGIFHFANRGAFSRYELAQTLLEEAKRCGVQLACRSLIPVPSSAFPTPAKRPAYSVLDTAKIEALIGAPRSWNEALKEYLIDVQA